MGNVPVSITIEATPKKESRAYEAMETAFAEARRIEGEVSEWKPTSQTSLLNQNAGKEWVPVGRNLLEILRQATEVSELTDGAFDITFTSPRRDASFRDVGIIPELSLAMLKRKQVKIGVSGIAKGYIVDRMSDLLKKKGFKKFLINAGDLYASGRWEVGIRDPDYPGEEKTVCKLTVNDQAVSTTGTYERGPHIINPKTKKPVSNLKSITVIANSSTFADALATGAFVLGKDQLPSLVEKIPDIKVFLIDTSSPPRCVPLP